jgi:hypothetical protein
VTQKLHCTRNVTTKRPYVKFIDTVLAFIKYFKCSKGLPSTSSSSKCSRNTCTYRLTNLSIVIKIIMCTNFLLLNIECQVTFAPPGILFAQNRKWPGLNCIQPDVHVAKKVSNNVIPGRKFGCRNNI